MGGAKGRRGVTLPPTCGQADRQVEDMPLSTFHLNTCQSELAATLCGAAHLRVSTAAGCLVDGLRGRVTTHHFLSVCYGLLPPPPGWVFLERKFLQEEVVDGGTGARSSTAAKFSLTRRLTRYETRHHMWRR